MKILLITPPRAKIPPISDFPPLGLGFIGAVAKQGGHQVRIIDASLWSWEKIRLAMQEENPDVIGTTCWTIERGQTFKTAHLAGETLPHAKIVMGGPHATAFPEHIFIKTPADYVVCGEGEETFRELLLALERKMRVDDIYGLAFRRDGQLRINPPRALLTDLDRIPFIDHSQFDYRSYRGNWDTHLVSAAVFTSRGCPFKCIFCSSSVYWQQKYRKRSVANVLQEVEILYHEHGVRSILFFDDNLVLDRERCIALSKGLIDLNLDLTWAAEGSVRVDPELLDWMKRAGCYRIDFGVESGSPQILKNIKKAFSVGDTRRTFRLCKEAGIKPNAYLVIGSPGETEETIRQTASLMREIQPEIRGIPPGLWILPNTELYEMSLRQGIISEQSWLESDETFFYTAEHSMAKLSALADLFNKEMER